MSLSPEKARQTLGRSHGFLLVAEDGPAGDVETPLFPADQDEPDYLIVRTRQFHRRVIATAQVKAVDPERQLVFVHGCVFEIEMLPEHLPLAVERSEQL